MTALRIKETITSAMLLVLFISMCAFETAMAQFPPEARKYIPIMIAIDDIEPAVMLPTTTPEVTVKVVNLGSSPVPSAKVAVAVDGTNQPGSAWMISNLAGRTSVVKTLALGTLPLGVHTVEVSYLTPAKSVPLKGMRPSDLWTTGATDSQDFWVVPVDLRQGIPQILGFDENLTAARNRFYAGASKPNPAVCGQTCTLNGQNEVGFLGELQCPGRITDSKIPYEWAPIVPGSIPQAPTVRTPGFYAAGTVVKWSPGRVDVKFSHPFGWRNLQTDSTAVDQSVDVWMDPAYSDLVFPPDKPFHLELEAGAWPVGTFGFTPQPGDRMLAIGNWIMDCGHPGSNWNADSHWSSEIHPPVFLAFARQYSPTETISHSFANPYRVTQLYTMHAGNDQNGENWGERFRFDDPIESQRYTDRLTLPFPRFLYERIEDGFDPSNHRPLEVHPIVEALRFEPISWYVCAPPKPPNATGFDYRAHFTLRSGVQVLARKHEDLGCMEFQASMNASYVPMSVQRLDYAWDWNDINCEAGVAANQNPPPDVRQFIKNNDYSNQNIDANVDKTPMIDRFAPLMPIGGEADQKPDRSAAQPGGTTDPQPGVLVSDLQPFPFYGWARVFWDVPFGSTRVNQPHFSAMPDHLDLDNTSAERNVDVRLVVGLANLGTRAVKINRTTVIGMDAALFRISKDTCSGVLVGLSGGCTVSVMHYKPTHPGSLNASLLIYDSDGNFISIPLTTPGIPESPTNFPGCPAA
jgi:hypothetical protein